MKARIIRLAGIILLAGLIEAATAGGCGPEPVELRDAWPWQSGELSVVEWQRDGRTFFYEELSVLEKDGQILFSLERLSTNYPQMIQISLQPDTLMPVWTKIESGVEGAAETLYAEYGEKNVKITRSNDDGEEEKYVSLPAQYFDNEQLMLLIRALELEVGMEKDINLIVVHTASRAQVALAVTGQETVAVAAGTFDTYVVELKDLGQKAWVGVEPPYPVVKYENSVSGFIMELVEFFPEGR